LWFFFDPPTHQDIITVECISKSSDCTVFDVLMILQANWTSYTLVNGNLLQCIKREPLETLKLQWFYNLYEYNVCYLKGQWVGMEAVQLWIVHCQWNNINCKHKGVVRMVGNACGHIGRPRKHVDGGKAWKTYLYLPNKMFTKC